MKWHKKKKTEPSDEYIVVYTQVGFKFVANGMRQQRLLSSFCYFFCVFLAQQNKKDTDEPENIWPKSGCFGY